MFGIFINYLIFFTFLGYIFMLPVSLLFLFGITAMFAPVTFCSALLCSGAEHASALLTAPYCRPIYVRSPLNGCRISISGPFYSMVHGMQMGFINPDQLRGETKIMSDLHGLRVISIS